MASVLESPSWPVTLVDTMLKSILFFVTLSTLLATPIFLLFEHIIDSKIPLSFLYAINSASYIMMAIDKRQARTGGLRVPEVLLLGLAILGGTIGICIASITLHHKTKKPLFLIFLLAIGIIQITIYRAIQTSESFL